MPDLSVIIPARREMWLAHTVADVCRQKTADTEVIVVLDGEWPDPGLPQHPDVHVVYHATPIGQRASTNLAARLSTARYVMKLDAHCAVAPGFDSELIRAAGDLGQDVTQIPAQHNLHIFDWVCEACGKRTYQGPTPGSCACGSPALRRDVVWNAVRRRTEFWRFDSEIKFQYWNAYKHRPEAQGDIVDVMTALGACFFMARDRYWDLGGLDEDHGSWGNFGIEIALKSALSGGRHVVNRRTWFSHLFRTQGGDFGFPYAISGSEQEYARAYSRNLWRGNRWPGQVRTLRSLVQQFWPVPGWTEEALDALPRQLDGGTPRHAGVRVDESPRVGLSASAVPRRAAPSKGLVYYTDNRLDRGIAEAVRHQLASLGLPLVAVSLAPLDWTSATNLVLPLERGYLAMFRQIMSGLEALDTDVAFLVEHDVLYAREHVEFIPPRRDCYYYNAHVWKVDAETGRALHYRCNQTSGLCADRALLLAHYRARVAAVEAHGFHRNNGFEPGTRKIRHGGFDDVDFATWMSKIPNIDIRHGQNLTPSRWRKDQFRNQKYTEGWTESDRVPGWGVTKGRFREFLLELRGAGVAA